MSSSQRGSWKSSKSLGWALLLLCSASAWSGDEPWFQELGPSLSFRGGYWQRDKSYSDRRHYLTSSAWLSLRPTEIAGTKFFFDGYVARNDSLRSSAPVWEAREGYAERAFGSLDLRVGRQIIVWGRADKVNPTDVWSSRNYKLLATDDEDQRLGAFAASAAYNWSNYRLIGIYQPEWREPVYPIPPLPGLGVTSASPRGAATQFGFKLDHTGSPLDWSLSYARVLSRIPQLTVSSSPNGPALLELHYDRVQVWGGDFAFNWGDFGLRGEAAYTRSADDTGADPTRFNSEIFGVLGADRSLVENLNLNLQVLYKHVFDFRAPTTALGTQENLISNQLGSDRWGLSFRPSYKLFHETLELETAYVQWFQNPGGLVRPKASYAISDRVKAIVGAEVYFGTPQSFFGRLSEGTSGFSEIRIGF